MDICKDVDCSKCERYTCIYIRLTEEVFDAWEEMSYNKYTDNVLDTVYTEYELEK